MIAAGFFKLYGVALITFFAMDLLWLGVVARGFYQTHMGHLMKPSVNWAAAVAFYLLFLVGLVVLVILPAVERQSFAHAVLLGALFGLVTYAAYDLTNLLLSNQKLPTNKDALLGDSAKKRTLGAIEIS